MARSGWYATFFPPGHSTAVQYIRASPTWMTNEVGTLAGSSLTEWGKTRGHVVMRVSVWGTRRDTSS
jgi:hypothetical protein